MDLGVFVSSRVGRVKVVVVAWASHRPHTGSFVLFLLAKKNFSHHPPSPRTVVNVTPLIIKNLIKIDFFLSFRLFSHIQHSVRLVFLSSNHIAHSSYLAHIFSSAAEWRPLKVETFSLTRHKVVVLHIRFSVSIFTLIMCVASSTMCFASPTYKHHVHLVRSSLQQCQVSLHNINYLIAWRQVSCWALDSPHFECQDLSRCKILTDASEVHMTRESLSMSNREATKKTREKCWKYFFFRWLVSKHFFFLFWLQQILLFLTFQFRNSRKLLVSTNSAIVLTSLVIPQFTFVDVELFVVQHVELKRPTRAQQSEIIYLLR